MSSLGHSAFHAGISGLRARSALASAYQQGDVKKVKRFFKTVDMGARSAVFLWRFSLWRSPYLCL